MGTIEMMSLMYEMSVKEMKRNRTIRLVPRINIIAEMVYM